MNADQMSKNAPIETDEAGLAAEILDRLAQPISDPLPGCYLTQPKAENIVDRTLQEIERRGDGLELAYLSTHRRRLAKSLALIPHASGPDASCLDIGCFGYMSFWAKLELGYAHVTGVEWRPDVSGPYSQQRLALGGDSIDLKVHNFDIGRPNWPLTGVFDTVLFFETLEHTNTDPVGIMDNIGRLLSRSSTLVMSVPNAISYKTLHEFLSGNPPWVYWFFHPDLKHEPRHCFEYTPFILHHLLRSAGFTEAASQSMIAFGEQHDIEDAFALAADLSIDARWFGETLLTQARKTSDSPPIRYPACIYDASEYYKLVHPVIYPVLRKAMETYKNARTESWSKLTAAEEEVRRLSALNLEASRNFEKACEDLHTIVHRYERQHEVVQAALGAAEALATEREGQCENAWSMLADAQKATEARVAERERERDDARAKLANTQNRASAVEIGAWRIWQAELQRSRKERDFLAGYLLRTYERPWRPFKHRVLAGSLRALSGLVAPVSKRMSARFANSARKRSAKRFEAFLGEPPLSAETKARRQEDKLNILYFSPFPSHPAAHGNQATIQQFGKRFQALGHKVHFALLESPLFDVEAEHDMRGTWNSFHILPNTKQLWANGAEIPFDGWYEEGLGERVQFLCALYDIDVVFCSYVFQSKLLEYAPSHILKVIDTHDKMGDRYEMLRTNGQPVEFFSCTPKEEGQYLRRADVVVARREEEALYFNSVMGQDAAIVIPHIEDPRFVAKAFHELANVGVVASANRINLAVTLEFLQTLARQCGAAPPFSVHIAGQVRDMVKDLDQESAKAFSAPWVTMHGFVPDIGDFYRRMDVIVSPVTMGTGINVKTVQAMAYGMPLITTKCGSKGIATDEPTHAFTDLSSLVAGLLSLSERPQDLNRLAAVSRERYGRFYAEAGRNICLLFQHEKLKGFSKS